MMWEIHAQAVSLSSMLWYSKHLFMEVVATMETQWVQQNGCHTKYLFPVLTFTVTLFNYG